MPLDRRPVRVALVQTPVHHLMPLSEYLSSEKNWECFEFQSNPDEAWKLVIGKNPDLTVFFFPAVGAAERRNVGRVLIGCKTRVFIVTFKRPDPEVESTGNRVDICVISGPESARSAVYAMSRLIDNIRATLPPSSTAASPYTPPARTTTAVRPPQTPQYGTAVRPRTAAAAEKVLPPPSAFEGLIIAIGASTGGTEALEKVFLGLSVNMPGIVVVQHMPPVFPRLYANRLNEGLPFTVTEAADNVLIRPGTIHIAPGDRHLTIKRRGSSYYTCVGGTEKVNSHCPSVDVLFESVAAEAGPRALGVILTGMGADGAKGLLSMRNKGAYTLGQDEASCVVYGMPFKAYECGAVVRQATLLDIPRLISAHYAR